MNRNVIFGLILVSLIFTCGCVQQDSKGAAIRINEFVMSAAEFQEAFKNSSYSAAREDKEKFLEDLINRKLIIQEAQRQGLDKRQEFLREIERFWEKTLLKNIIDRKSKELTGGALVNEDEMRAEYDRLINQGLTEASYEESYDQIKWQLLRHKQIAAFDNWLEQLRGQARIEVNRELLGAK